MELGTCFPFLGHKECCVFPDPRPLFYHSLGEVGWVTREGPSLGRREGKIMMCLEQHFLSNSGIKIPRSRACDRHCWSWYYPWGGSAPCARPVRWTAIASALVKG